MGYVYKKMTASTVGICIVLELSIHLKNAMNLPAQAKCQSSDLRKRILQAIGKTGKENL